MSSSVLFDVPGPKTRARHRIYTVVAWLVLVAVIAAVLVRMSSTGQLAYAKWEPFVTPSYLTALLVDGLLKTLQMAFSSVHPRGRVRRCCSGSASCRTTPGCAGRAGRSWSSSAPSRCC